MEWFKKHADALMVIAAIFGSMCWMNGRFNEIEKDLTIVKTVLIMKKLMPVELAHTGE